jgi:hypothetical protein
VHWRHHNDLTRLIATEGKSAAQSFDRVSYFLVGDGWQLGDEFHPRPSWGGCPWQTAF